MDALELKVPPPVAGGVVALLMWVVARVVPPLPLPTGVRLGLAAVFAVTGGALAVSALVSFRHKGTTWEPSDPRKTCAIVETGPYRFTRNPMYLGILLVLFGWAWLLANLASLAVTVLFVMWLDRFQIAPEERLLTEAFGQSYLAYKARVRRWL